MTIALVLHWPWVTELAICPTTASTAIERQMSTLHPFWAMPPLPLNYLSHILSLASLASVACFPCVATSVASEKLHKGQCVGREQNVTNSHVLPDLIRRISASRLAL